MHRANNRYKSCVPGLSQCNLRSTRDLGRNGTELGPKVKTRARARASASELSHHRGVPGRIRVECKKIRRLRLFLILQIGKALSQTWLKGLVINDLKWDRAGTQRGEVRPIPRESTGTQRGEVCPIRWPPPVNEAPKLEWYAIIWVLSRCRSFNDPRSIRPALLSLKLLGVHPLQPG